MEVVAVSHFRPKLVVINGLPLKTSIVHTPMTSPDDFIEPNETGIVDNQPAGHDGPVYMYLAENYDYWAKELGVNRNIIFRCTGDKLDEEDFHIGDIWRVGNGVRLQVCGARIPCMKLSWRLGQKDSLLKPFADSGKAGVYLRVLDGARIHPGDVASLERVMGDPVSAGMSNKVAFDASLKTTDTVDLLTKHYGILGMIRHMMRTKLAKIDDKMNSGRGSWKGWRYMCVDRVVDEGADVKSFHLKAADGEPLALYLSGQCQTVRLPDGRLRNWTISDWTGRGEAQASYRLSIKKGQGCSQWMHESCTTDTVLSVRSPAGRFVLGWDQGLIPRQMYISAGIGMTCMLAMMKAHAEHPNMAHIPGVWIHVARVGQHLPMIAEEFETIPGKPNKRVMFFTKLTDSDVQGEHFDPAGRPSPEYVSKLLSGTYKMNPLGVTDMDVPGMLSTAYICGPGTFEKDTKAALAAAHVPPHFVPSEAFSASGAAMGDVARAKVRIAKSKREVTWSKEKPMSLLELAESVGMAPEFGCRVGSCGSCAAKLDNGRVCGPVQMDGTVLVCSATPAEEELVLDL